MTELNPSAMASELQAVADRIEEKVREFRLTGEFAKTHQHEVEIVAARARALQLRVDAAAASGSTWQSIKAQALRDYLLIFNNFLMSFDRLDAAEMRKHGEQ